MRMTDRRISRYIPVFGVIAVLVQAVTGSAPVAAQEAHRLPVPAFTIYPGQIVQDDMLVDAQISGLLPAGVIDTRAQLLGRVARRTLLSGQPVTKVAVGDARLIVNGARVPVIYQEGALTILTYATALQSGSAGETVSLRNLDSGRTISGVVQADGTVLVGAS